MKGTSEDYFCKGGSRTALTPSTPQEQDHEQLED
ncbi:MAG: hypothetical protein CDV28_1586 [Candidatus Electronema aureum]|uniref:Uncharacterized protein n=1 Tax=Candidatus Electronema aureum TaxID=2005002 RepID=A0A521FYG2_9BACT|nr:MAG: hypothetical protein CDV28_1586 [Candidatus Electronema aureum]